MEIFYAIRAEFYNLDTRGENGREIGHRKTLACIERKQAKTKPKNQMRREYGITVFKIWLTSKERAETLLGLIKNGEIYIDDLISFYNDCLPLEGRSA